MSPQPVSLLRLQGQHALRLGPTTTLFNNPAVFVMQTALAHRVLYEVKDGAVFLGCDAVSCITAPTLNVDGGNVMR